jgi:hypothetical protein
MEEHHTYIKKMAKNVLIYLIGLQSDMPRSVPKEDGKLLAQKLGCVAFYETSSKTGEGVDQVFQDIARRAAQSFYFLQDKQKLEQYLGISIH